MKFAFVVVLGLILLIYGGLNFYIGLRGWQAFFGYIPFLNQKVYWAVFGLIASSYILARLTAKFVPPWLHEGLSKAGALWLGVFFYALLLIASIDILRFLNQRFSILPEHIAKGLSSTPFLGGAVILLLIGLLIWGGWNAQHPVVKEYTVQIGKRAGNLSSLKAVMVTDVHLGTIIHNSHLEKLVGKINERDPDIVVFVGDMLDEDIRPFIEQEMGRSFGKIKSRYGVYAVPGNHEYIGGNADQVTEELSAVGVKVLRDETVKVADSFYLVGRDDLSRERFGKEKRKDLKELMAGTDQNLPVIVLDHQPSAIDESKENGADLHLSGHTHYGQLFPIHWITGRLFKNDYGLLQEGNFTSIVSCGYGTWGPPVRLGSRSEIVQINIRFLQ